MTRATSKASMTDLRSRMAMSHDIWELKMRCFKMNSKKLLLFSLLLISTCASAKQIYGEFFLNNGLPWVESGIYLYEITNNSFVNSNYHIYEGKYVKITGKEKLTPGSNNRYFFDLKKINVIVKKERVPFKVRFEERKTNVRYYGEYIEKEIFITSLSNNLVLTGLRLNKGNCRYNNNITKIIMNQEQEGLYTRLAFPWPIRYGETAKIKVHCQPIRINVFTNEGSYKLNNEGPSPLNNGQ